MLKIWPIVLLCFLLFWEYSLAYEYCLNGRNKTLCGGRRHIVCNPEQMNEKREETMPNTLFAVVPTTSKIKRLIIERHNAYRNHLACGETADGKFNKFPRAVRMRELIWDDELAYLARRHVLLCVYAHDECHNTVRFRYAGQNIAWFGKNDFEDIMMMFEKGVFNWFSEHKYIANAQGAADKYPPEKLDDKPIGHFTVMSQEKSSRIGCAMSCYMGSKAKVQYMLTCNYDWTNIVGVMMYKNHPTGAATECEYWGNERSVEYPCLCTNNGNYKYEL